MKNQKILLTIILATLLFIPLLTSMVSADDLFVAVGESGSIQTSSDGVNWVSTILGTTLFGVTWSPELELLVTTGTNGYFSLSDDGVNWTSSNIAGMSHLFDVEWVSELDLFIVVGNNGKLATSPDGVNWTQRTSGFDITETIRGITWSPELELLVAVGRDGSIRRSTNGIDWVNTSQAGTYNFNSVAWSPDLELFVAVGDGGIALTSSDGVTWDWVSAGPYRLWDITWSPQLEMFVASGDGNSMVGRAYTSSDGEWWVSYGAGPHSLEGVKWSAELGLFVAVGVSGAVSSSSDGYNWTNDYAGANTLKDIVWTGSGIIFEQPEVQSIGFNDLTYNSVELVGNLSSIGTPENVSVFFQYKKQSEQNYINTPTQLLSSEQEITQLIEELDQNTPYEFRAVVLYADPDIQGPLTKYGDNINFTTEPVIFTDNFLIGKRYKGNSRDNIFKYDLVNDNYLEYETENFITGTNRFWFDNNNDIISLIDRNPDVSYRLTILNLTDLTIIEEILIPNSQFTNPSGVSLSENELFVGVENKIFVLNLDTYTGSYSNAYSTFSNDINIVETDDSNVYFTRKNSGGMWSFEKNNINMSFTTENSFSTSTPKEIILLQNEVFIIGQNEVRLFTKDNTLVFNTSHNNDNYVVGSISYDETRNKIYYATQNTLGICPQFNLYEVDLSNGQINNTLNIDYENSACVNPYFIGVSYDDELIYLTGKINSDNTMRIYSKNTYDLLEEQETPYRLDQTSIKGSLQIAETVPTILGFPESTQLNQNEQFSINLGDYFKFVETINLSVHTQNPNDVLPENFSFNGIYNYDYTQFEYEPLTFELNYLSKLLDFEVVFKATACNEFGCVEDLLKIETFIVPLVIEKSFPDILIKPDSFKYYFVDNYIDEEEENITSIILRDEDLSQELVYTYSISENIINQYYSLTMSEDVNGRTFIYVESFSEERTSNMSITFVDDDGLEIIEEFKLIITEDIPLNIKSVPNPIMDFNDLYELNLSEYYEEFTIVFFGWYETDNNEYKFLLPNEQFSTSYAEFSYINDTISINSFEENYFFETSPASIQACNTNGCTQTTELIFTISQESFFDKTFGSLFPSSETLSNSQKMTRVLITIMALIGLVVILGVQSPEARPYLVPVGTLVVMLSIIAFTLMGYLSVVLLITLIFVGVMIGVGLVRRILQGSSGGD